MTGEGVLDGSSISVAAGQTPSDPDRTHPAVAGYESTGQYLVTWTEQYSPFLFTNVAGRAVSTGGDLLGEETYVSGIFADNAAVAGGWLGSFLVAFDDMPLTASKDIYGRLWGNRIYLPLALRNH